mgnify:CR=1 FL=1
MNLINKKCVPCEGGAPPLTKEQVREYLVEVPEWRVAGDYKKIRREFTFKNFVEAMRFVNRVAELAESEGHHPDLHVAYSRVRIELWTHAVHGLSENDFILAAKINKLLKQ